MELKPGPIKGWKAFDMNLKCKGFQFEIGGTYENRHQIFTYYHHSTSRVCEVIACDVYTASDKSVCKKIEIVREISFIEALSIAGDGYGYGGGYGYGYGYGRRGINFIFGITFLDRKDAA